MTKSIAVGAQDPIRNQLGKIIESPAFRNAILGVILFNAVLQGLETSGSTMSLA